MTDPSIGHVVDIQDRDKSRREVTVTSGLTSVQRLVLMPGVLGTDDGAAVIAAAADLNGVVFGDVRRSKPRGRKPTGE